MRQGGTEDRDGVDMSSFFSFSFFFSLSLTTFVWIPKTGFKLRDKTQFNGREVNDRIE